MVSIIIPTYNCDRYVAETLNSIIDQTYNDFEAIIVDNASTDNTVQIVNEIVKNDPRFKIIEMPENRGAAGGRNAGIAIAAGKYISFVDSDDLWLPDKLEKQVDFMDQNNFSFTYTYYEMIDQDGKPLGKIKKSNKIADYKTLLKSNFIGCSTVMYNQFILGKVFMPEIAKRNDFATWLKILRIVDHGYCVEKVLVRYRVHANSLSSNKLSLVKYNWKLFRELEGFGIIKSAYYLSHNVINKILG